MLSFFRMNSLIIIRQLVLFCFLAVWINSEIDAAILVPKKVLAIGQMSELRNSDPTTQTVAEQVQSQIADKAKEIHVVMLKYVLIKYATQVTTGINYFMKIQIADQPTSYVHARVHVGFLRHRKNKKVTIEKVYQLDGLEFNRTLPDSLKYIQPFHDVNPYFTVPHEHPLKKIMTTTTTTTTTTSTTRTTKRKRPQYGSDEE